MFEGLSNLVASFMPNKKMFVTLICSELEKPEVANHKIECFNMVCLPSEKHKIYFEVFVPENIELPAHYDPETRMRKYRITDENFNAALEKAVDGIVKTKIPANCTFDLAALQYRKSGKEITVIAAWTNTATKEKQKTTLTL